MSFLRRTMPWFALLVTAFCIVTYLRQMIVVPAATQGSHVCIVNPDQVLVTAPSETIMFTVLLRNLGSDPVVITGCEAGCSCTIPVGLPVTLPADSECSLPFQLTAGVTEGSVVRQEIRIYTVPPIPNPVASVESRVRASSSATSIPE